MEVQACSIGDFLNMECHKNTYVSNSSTSEILDDEKHLLSVRTGIQKGLLKKICTHHSLQYGKYYASNQKTCSDPLSIHSKPVKRNLTCITLEHHHINQSLIPGRKIYFGCLRKLKSEKEDVSNDPDYVPPEHTNSKVESLNVSLGHFGISPVKRSSSLSKSQIQNKIQAKVRKLNMSLNEADVCENDNAIKSDSLHYFVGKLKEKFDNESNISEKIKLLTLVPVHWTIEETIREFETTQYMVRQARSLKDSRVEWGTFVMWHGSSHLHKNICLI